MKWICQKTFFRIEDGDKIIFYDNDDKYSYKLSKEEYQLLLELSQKYDIELDLILQILVRENKAVKTAKKKGVIKDLKKIINNYLK